MNSGSPASLSAGLLSRKGMAAPSAGPETRANLVGTPGDPNAETTRPQQRQGLAPARSTLADWVAPEPKPSAAETVVDFFSFYAGLLGDVGKSPIAVVLVE